MYNFRGYGYKGMDIFDFDKKLDAIGFNHELVLRREDIYLYLMHYLGVVTKDQLCKFANVLDGSIRTSINRLNSEGEVVEVEKDMFGNTFYTLKKKGFYKLKELIDNLEESKGYTNKLHLSKANDAFFCLFESRCNEITIIHEKSYEDDDSSIRADAVINLKCRNTNYELKIEQDNNTESLKKLIEKVYLYYNFDLKNDFVKEDKVRFVIFRQETKMVRSHFKVCDNKTRKDPEYIKCVSNIEKLERLYDEVKQCNNINDYYNAAFELGVVYSDRTSVFLKNISTKKTSFLLKIDEIKRKHISNYNHKLVKDRVNNFRMAMFGEFGVVKFDGILENSLYFDITGQTRFSIENEKMDGRTLLLRTNYMCGDNSIEEKLKKFLFGRVNILIPLFNREMRGSSISLPEDVQVKQQYLTVGNETLCFSNMVVTEIEGILTNFILFIPTISTSDHARIEYLNSLDAQTLRKSFVNKTYFVIAVTDDQSKKQYEQLTLNYKGDQSAFIVGKVDMEEDF